MYQLILHKLQAARCTKRAAEGTRVARRGSPQRWRYTCRCVCVRAGVTVVCLFPVTNNYLFSLRAEIFFLCLPLAKGRSGGNGNYTNNNNLKDLSPSHKGRIVAERAIKIN